MGINNTGFFRLSFLSHWYFIALAFAPVVCFIDYRTVDQGFDKIYGSTILIMALALFIVRGWNHVIVRYYIPAGILAAIFYTSWDVILWQDTIARKGVIYEFFLNRSLHAVAVLFVVDNLVFSKNLIQSLIKIMKGLIVVGAIVSLLQVIHNPFFFTPEKFQASMLHYHWENNPLLVRRLSIFGFTNINDVGMSFLPILALVVSYEIKENNRIPILMLLLGFFIAVVNNSRYIQLGFFIAAAPVLFYQGKILRNFLIGMFGIVVLVLLMGLVLHFIGYDVGRYVEERLLDESGGTRLLALEIFGRFFPENPFFGTGTHITQEVFVALADRSSQIHVGYLAHLFSFGLVGTFLALLFWSLIALRLWKVGIKTGFYGSFFGFLVFLWSNVSMVFYWVFTFGLALSYLFASYYDGKFNEESKYTESTD